jgi:hypothetical protein
MAFPFAAGRKLERIADHAVIIGERVGYIVAAAFIARSVVSSTAEGATGARLVATILAGQALGVVPPSLHFQNPVPAAILNTTLDRYLLPLLPLALCLAVWGVAAMRVPPWPAWVVTAGFAVVAVSGTRDFLHFQDRIWQVAVAANEAGIENTRLDSGAQWNGEHLYQGWDDMPPSRHDQP